MVCAVAAKDPARSATAAPPPRDAAARAIAEHLPYLQVSDEEVARFRRACRDNGVELESERKKRIARLFLLSSDFFANGENVERPVRFVTLFGPYSSPCYQPLMHMKT